MKLELYKPYKTKNGHKAVPIAMAGNDFLVAHVDNGQQLHSIFGSAISSHEYFDIVEEWHEPRKGEFWVNVYENGAGRCWITKADAEASKKCEFGIRRVALKRVAWTEGDEE